MSKLRKSGHYRQISGDTEDSHSYQSHNAPSTRRMLSDMSPNPQSPLAPPQAPFTTQNSRPRSQRSEALSLSPSTTSITPTYRDISLSVNYLPSKFSGAHSPGVHRRRGNKFKDDIGIDIPLKGGGGREAFRRNEARMPGANDEDYDGFTGNLSQATKGRLRWNKFKWILVFSNTIFTAYSLSALIFCLLTVFNVWPDADVVRVGNAIELSISLLASALGVLTSLIGWAGILLNNRTFLAIYTLLLWVTFGLLVTPGYIAFKTRSLDLEAKLSNQWSRALGPSGRLRIQNQLQCCGYFSPFVEATVSQTCYSRSLLPGCKGPYNRFERFILERWYTIAFSLVPLQLGCIVAALLCSNHITYRFGKGMMPKAYRLSLGSMAIIMDNYANYLAEEYGATFASEVINRSRSNPALRSDPSITQPGRERPSAAGRGPHDNFPLSGPTTFAPSGNYNHSKHL